MLPLNGLSPYVRGLLARFCSWTQQSCYMSMQSPDRYYDVLEMYAGQSNLSFRCEQVSWMNASSIVILNLLLGHESVCSLGLFVQAGFLVARLDRDLHASHDVLTEAGKIICYLAHFSICCVVWCFTTRTNF